MARSPHELIMKGWTRGRAPVGSGHDVRNARHPDASGGMLNGVTTVERWLEAENVEGWRLEISGRAVMEGVIGVLTNRAFRGETAQLAQLHGDLVAWVFSYAARGRPRLSPEDWRRLGASFVEATARSSPPPAVARARRSRPPATPTRSASRR